MTRHTLLGLLVILSVLIVACDQQPTAMPTEEAMPEATLETTEESGDTSSSGADLGAALATFETQCQSCHGEEGMNASFGPSLNPNEEVAAMSAAQLREIIAGGIEGSEMPAFGDQLSDQEIDNLVALIQSWQSGSE